MLPFRLRVLRRLSPLLLALALLSRAIALQELNILSPDTAYARYKDNPIVNNPALFGSPPYGSGITGRLLYAQNAQYACTTFNTTAVPNWPAPPSDPSQPAPSVILMVDRGGSTSSDPCTFVEKVYNAQLAGAAAVVVVNAPGQPLPFMKSDGSDMSLQINIPAMIIGSDDGEYLKGLLSGVVNAQLRWGLPHPDDRVEWSLWLTPVNFKAKSFLTALSTVSDALGEKALFTPQYFVKKTGCPGSLPYCSYDEPPSGVSDQLVIDETVRQLCVYQVSNQTNQMGAWWRYMALFYDRCFTSFSDKCSKDLLNSLWISSSAVDDCWTDSWSPTVNTNTLLEQQLADQAALGAWISPTLLINSEPFAGSLYCGGPVKKSTCAPLNALCAGFLEGQQPALCDCDVLGTFRDECGVCGGTNACKAPAPSSSGGMSWGTLAIIAVVVAAVGALVFFAYTRRQRRLARLEIDEILRGYVPLADEGKAAHAASGSATGTGGGRHEFAEEEDEEELVGHLSAGIGSALRSDPAGPAVAKPGPPPPPPSAGAVAAAAPRSAFAIGEQEEDVDLEV